MFLFLIMEFLFFFFVFCKMLFVKVVNVFLICVFDKVLIFIYEILSVLVNDWLVV